MKGIIGKKLGMTRVFTEDAVAVPVTVIEAGPCPVLDKRTSERDGYAALQIGFGNRKVKNVSKALLGHLKKSGSQDSPPACISEIRGYADADKEVGDVLDAAIFEKGEFVDISGRTKGRGFQGTVKRFNFGGGKATHGCDWLRKPGSVGMCVDPGRVYKGRPMPGHMGCLQRTVQNLEVVDVRPEENVILVKGAVPGSKGSYVVVHQARKK
ncbi:MAG: 50S ribosomal protein L3 [Lentisphaeria bacterium]